MALAYSYIRFSSERQSRGDSLRRQVELAERYAHAHRLDLDTHSYRDLGVSAYKGRNAVQGKLGTFVRAVETGVVPSGSLLLVESLDRISRNDVDDALVLFLSIIRLGVTVVTLADNQVYSTESIKRDHGMSLIVSIVVMMRAHEESAMRAARTRANWTAAAAKGGVFTRSYPCWLARDEGRWVVDEHKAEIVQGIFAWYLEGFGAPTIARWLNSAEIEPISGRAQFWAVSTISRLIRHRAVTGELQQSKSPDLPIAGYYPAIVSKAIFDKAQLLSSSRHWQQQHFEFCYMFGSFGSCTECGARVHKIGGWSCNYRIQCSRSFLKAGCSAPTLSGRTADVALVKELAYGTVVNSLLDESGIRAAREQLPLITDRIQTLHAERRELLEAAISGTRVSLIQKKVKRLESDMAKLEGEAEGLRRVAAPGIVADLAAARRLSFLMLTDGQLMRDMLPWQRELSAILRRILASVAFDAARRHMTLTFVGGLQSEVELVKLPGGARAGNDFYKLRRRFRQRLQE